ncbi:MAG: GPW/gp25 family protein [Beijerinckiaceae bacterium]|nr:GPW/gp25 family protein [Beijerinckiaceae bacterium]
MALIGWRFHNLGAAQAEGSIMPAGPYLTPSGGVAMVRDDDAIHQAIVMLLATRPGERVMRPGYGCPLDRLVFAPNDATTAGLAIHYVSQAIGRWEPRIEILRLNAGPTTKSDGDDSILEIRLDYRVRESQRRESLLFALDLGSEDR